LRRRRLVAAAACVLLVGTALPALAEPGSVGERLEESRRELADVRSDLSSADQEILRAAQRLAEIDDLLAVRAAELRRLEAELSEAEEAHREAQRRTMDATRKVNRTAAELDRLVAEEAEYKRRLDERAANTYMRGGGSRPGPMVTTLLGVTTLHDLAVGLRAVGVSLAADRALVDRTRELVTETAERRAELVQLRNALEDEEAAARQARAKVETLVDRQAGLVAEIEAEREERAAILARIEQDRTQLTALARQLESAIASLQRELWRDINVNWEDLDLDGPMPEWVSRLPARGHQWAPAIHQAATQVGVDPRLFAALVWSESSFFPDAVSSAGAIGLAQLMPGTAAMLGVDPWHPLQNLAGGSRYLAMQFATFGTVELALAAYNAGPGAVQRYGGIPPFTETQLYVIIVLQRYSFLAGA
jgi:soluble lytic murein transglycosylase-like protein